jgi:small-conductance mechanosensitive channel
MKQWFTKIWIALILINMLLSGWFIIWYWAANQVTISATFIKVWFVVWSVVACVMIIKFAFVKYKPQIKKAIKNVDKEDVKEVISDVKDILD